MKTIVRNDFIKRTELDIIFVIWVYYKSVYVSKESSDKDRRHAYMYLTRISSKIAPIFSCVNFSIVAGGSRSVMRKFGRNRHVVREMAMRGMLPGYSKAVW